MITHTGLEVAAHAAGCEPELLQAVINVEAAGSGFDSEGRLKMLFEPHIFYRLLSRYAPEDVEQAVDEGLAYPYQGAHPYPRDSYPRLDAAILINSDLALQSASWGSPQIMGCNYAKCGFGSVQQMVNTFKKGEDEQLYALAVYLLSQGLVNYLKKHEWAEFAKRYNGPNYQRMGYDRRLKNAYEALANSELAEGSKLTSIDPAGIGVPIRNETALDVHVAKVNNAGVAAGVTSIAVIGAEYHWHPTLPIAIGGVGIATAILVFAIQRYFVMRKFERDFHESFSSSK